MSLSSKLQSLEQQPTLPREAAKELTHPGGYRVVDVRRVDTKFGKSVVAEIIMPDQTNAMVFLPARFNKDLSDEDLIEIRGGTFKLRCTGMSGRSPNILIYQSQGRFSSNYKITIGADFTMKTIIWDDKTRINVQLWDIAGHERFGYMTRVYYKYAVGAAVVLDLTRSATIQSVTKWLQDLREKVTLADGTAVPVVLLANKCDVTSSVPIDLIARLCREYNIDGWFQTSAKENFNIDKAFDFLIRRSLQTKVPDPISKESIILKRKPIFDKKIYSKKQGCCH